LLRVQFCLLQNRWLLLFDRSIGIEFSIWIASLIKLLWVKKWLLLLLFHHFRGFRIWRLHRLYSFCFWLFICELFNFRKRANSIWLLLWSFKLFRRRIHWHISSFFSLFERSPLHAKIFVFQMNEFNLKVTQSESFSIDEAFDCIKLIHDYKILVIVTKSYSINIILKQIIIQLVMTSLFQFQI
jgi:hypothetical protein